MINVFFTIIIIAITNKLPNISRCISIHRLDMVHILGVYVIIIIIIPAVTTNYIIYTSFSFSGASEYGLYHFITRGELYVAYLTNDDTSQTRIIKLVPSPTSSHEGSSSGSGMVNINHNFSELLSSKNVYAVYNHCAYVAVGQDIIELMLDAEMPYFDRIRIGHMPTQVQPYKHLGRCTSLNVHYEKEGRGFVAIYRKCNNGSWRIKTVRKESRYEHFHDVTSRTKIICGEFVTVSPTLHHFCYIEAMEFGISCINVERAMLPNNDSDTGLMVLPNTWSVVCSSYDQCPVMWSHNDLLVAKVQLCEQDCEGIVMLFDMSTLENIANITGSSLDIQIRF